MNEETKQPFFTTLPLSPQLARAVEDLSYETATNIQAAAIPFLLSGKDLIGQSNTGTGKTAAFGIPAVECVNGENKHAQVLVLSPTRELALQTTREMQKYAKYKAGVCVATVYGGASMEDQIRLLRRANIVVGTPGRLMDHLRRKTLRLDDIKMVILDEADEMLSMGFIEDIQTILTQTPSTRQTVLFSATMSPSVLKISKEFLTDPEIIDVMMGQENKLDIEQIFYRVPPHRKQDALALLLGHTGAERSIIFCNTKSMADELAEKLHKQGFACAALHGDMNQAVRTRVMHSFRQKDIAVLIATDVAARGIDVDDVDAVINYDLPQSFEYYVHRIGRTGRAGRHGTSHTLICNSRQMSTLKALMQFTGDDIKEHRLPTADDMMARTVAKYAGELLPQLRGERGRAASMLIKRLLGDDNSGITTEDIAYALAEKLIGGDAQFNALKELESIVEDKASRKTRGMKSDEQSSMVTVRANIGERDRITPKHFMGALTELLNIAGREIGKIKIEEDYTYISLKEEDALALIKYRKPIRINNTIVAFKLKRSKAIPEKPSFRHTKDEKREKHFTKPHRKGVSKNKV